MGGRLRWLAVFTSVLLASTAVPVFAESEPAAGQSRGEEASQPPDPLAVQAALEESEQEESDRKEWLRGVEAERAREGSRLAFVDLNAAQIKKLLRDHFGRQLSFLNRDDPARVLSDAVIRDVYPGEGATLEFEGQKLLLDGSFPTHAENEEGDLRKVDLDLEATAEGFEAKNPLTDLRIADSAQGQIELGEKVSISSLGGEDSAALRFGEKDILFPGVHEDSDRLVAPVGAGVEIFDLLRSDESPETLRYSLTLPAGATLHAAGEGAEVRRDEEILMRVRPPVAIDGQGSDVPVEMQVEGDSLKLSVPHRKMDVAYPLLVDPYFEWEIQEDWYTQNWYNGYHTSDLYQWDWYTNSSWIYGKTYTIYNNFGGSGRGLHVSSKSGDFGPGKWGHWAYDLPNLNAYVEAISVLPFWYENHGCQKYYYQQPDDYVGLWDDVNDKWITLSYNDSYYKGWSNVGFSFEHPGWGHMVMIGLSMGSGPDIPCWRDFYAGGALVYLSDWADPEISDLDGAVNGWAGADTPMTLTANAHDAGLGVKEVVFDPSGVVGQFNVKHGCDGLAGSRCPTYWSAQKNITALSLDEGKRLLTATAHDALGRYSTAETDYTKVDRTPPKVTLSGQLANVTNEAGSEEKPAGEGDELVLPVYRLNIDATDGSNAEDKLRRSGVKDIRIRLDGVEDEDVPWSAQSCPQDSCEMNVTYELKLHDVEPGEHLLEVDVEDQVGEVRERNIEFEYFPATGMKDEYVMHYFPLPDGEGEEEEEEHPKRPELAVNVMNGNLVYRERDIDVEGPAVDLEVERYYNSMLPEEENTEWGDGWTLAQAPDLEPAEVEGPPSEGRLRDGSGALDEEVELPTTTGVESFDAALRATLTKEPGGYELTDETGESATSVAFDASGRTAELRTGKGTPEEATVDYSYEGGDLAEIAVEDPGSAGSPTEEPQEEGGGESEEPGELATFVSAFGSFGSGNGQLASPRDVAVDPEGNVWVADLYNNRIQQFTAAGQFIRTVGSSGSANGQLSDPSGIDVDAEGNLWVADAGNDRIQKFSPEGAYLGKFGEGGSDPGRMSSPAGLAIDAEGDIWVADTGNSRLQEFSPEGTFLGQLGEEGEGEGQLYGPEAIDVDLIGNVWVADTYGSRVQKFSPQGEYLLEAGVEAGSVEYPMGIAADAEGNVWVADTPGSHIQVFDSEGVHLGEVGSEGEGEGEFYYPMGIDIAPGGEVWIADTEGNRIQRWQASSSVTPKTGVYLGGTGSDGSEEGQFSFPIGIAVDPEGDVLVADTSNNRIQRFDEEGSFVEAFGTPGSGDGELSSPYGVATDSQGNVWVADSGNNRIQKFGPEGEYLAQFGEQGAGNGQFATPFGITIDSGGNIWVTEWANKRVQELGPEGQFIQKFGEPGTGNGQFSLPFDIAIDHAGRIWVSDAINSRLQQFGAQGQFIRTVGTEGEGEGQLAFPAGVDIDPKGNVWVADSANNRAQGFTPAGTYIGQFGEGGSEEGQLSLPYGFVVDLMGGFWIADTGNSRIGRWYPVEDSGPEEPLPQNDPMVDVETPGGLVSNVSGEEAGTHSYEHEGGLLTAHEGPQGETSYEYDEAGNLTKVTLPNGTWAEIVFDPDDGRVKSVTVDPAGEEPKRATYFEFSDEPRRTTVIPSDASHIVYEISADGSVLKWWNIEEPPVFDDLSGTLYDNRETSTPVEDGAHTLNTQAFSPEGIASIEVIADNDTLVDEVTCEQDPEEPGIECEELINQWVTEAKLHAPGRLYLEVIITDRLGNSTSERFWVKIPNLPPPLPLGAPEPPKFHDIKEFREKYGLEVVFPVANELELNERIFELMGAWYNGHSPAGRVARASMARWGVPMRAVDLAEMEYRERYLTKNSPIIRQWGENFHSEDYAGFYMDHRAGGKIRVGFTQNMSSRVDQLKEVTGLAAVNRIGSFKEAPTHPQVDLRGAASAAASLSSSQPGLLTRGGIDLASNLVRIGSTDPEQAQIALAGVIGGNAPTVVYYDDEPPSPANVRKRKSGPLRAGDHIFSGAWECTAGFGAREIGGKKPNGQPVNRPFLLTAAHCEPGVLVSRFEEFDSSGKRVLTEIGKKVRSGFDQPVNEFSTDGEAIKLHTGGLLPHWIQLEPGATQRYGGSIVPSVGMILCHSGISSRRARCGAVSGPPEWVSYDGRNMYQVPIAEGVISGDSGGPVWQLTTGNAVGLMSSGPEGPSRAHKSNITPLLPLPASEVPEGKAPGILAAPGMAPLTLVSD